MSTLNTLAAGGIVILALPALIFGGWLIVVALGALWLLATYGGKIGLDILKERQSGATAAKYKSKFDSRDDGQGWER